MTSSADDGADKDKGNGSADCSADDTGDDNDEGVDDSRGISIRGHERGTNDNNDNMGRDGSSSGSVLEFSVITDNTNITDSTITTMNITNTTTSNSDVNADAPSQRNNSEENTSQQLPFGQPGQVMRMRLGVRIQDVLDQANNNALANSAPPHENANSNGNVNGNAANDIGPSVMPAYDPFLRFSDQHTRMAYLTLNNENDEEDHGGRAGHRPPSPPEEQQQEGNVVERRTILSFEVHPSLILDEIFDETRAVEQGVGNNANDNDNYS